MAMLKYLRNKDGLPDPRGSLSTVMPVRTISSAKEAVRDTHKYNKTPCILPSFAETHVKRALQYIKLLNAHYIKGD